ncbi:hypothetical protein DICVIV_03849, partial [Dictyocaulus viviparus]
MAVFWIARKNVDEVKPSNYIHSDRKNWDSRDSILELPHIRRKSIRDPKIGTFPVIPPDLDEDWIESSVPRATTSPRPSTYNARSSRQIRFQIPEIQLIENEKNEVNRKLEMKSVKGKRECSFFFLISEFIRDPDQSLEAINTLPVLDENSSTEFDWSPAQTMNTVTTKAHIHPTLKKVQAMSLDETEDVRKTVRRNSSNERARQALLAQRRQSHFQLVQSMSGRRTSTTLIPLTQAQIHLIRALWRQIYTSKGPTVIGTSLYHRLCFKCPQYFEGAEACHSYIIEKLLKEALDGSHSQVSANVYVEQANPCFLPN